MSDEKVYDVVLTYDDYRRMPEGERYELLEGDLQLTPAPSPLHQRISRRIEVALNEYVENHDLGEVFHAPIDVVLSHTTVLQPDILFVAKGRAAIVGSENLSAAPDLVVEILSPSTTQRDRVTKRRLYGRYGVRELWIVDPAARSIEVCVHDGHQLVTRAVWQAGMEVESSILEGFRLPVEPVFA